VDAVKIENPDSILRQFFHRALERRGVKLGPDENVTCDTLRNTVSIDGSFNVDAWWIKGYGMHAPHRHARRRIYERELHSKTSIYDVFYNVCEELVHELFPVLPRNGKWRLFGRRPRCRG